MKKLFITGSKLRSIKFLTRDEETNNSIDFVIGSWGETENTLTFYTLENPDMYDDPHISQTHTISHNGNVNSIVTYPYSSLNNMENINQRPQLNPFLLTSSNGNVTLYHIENLHNKSTPNNQRVEKIQEYKLSKLPINSIDIESFSQQLISAAGDDGNVHIFSIEQQKHKSSSQHQPPPHIKLFDIRDKNQKPNKIFLNKRNLSSNYSLALHPTNPDQIVVGSADGSISVWDMRFESLEPIVSRIHSSAIWNLMFHPIYSNFLFSCSEDGSLDRLDFNRSTLNKHNNSLQIFSSSLFTQPLAINSFDIFADLIIGVSDSQNILIGNSQEFKLN
ncbi:nucleoporin nup43 [Anaeramoeba ignava]|uniref:Nucleoporin nup43 n=1 Tax=Anaeramoeba ignava TaxID=1746090 RepID=A0A9Q0LK64_ANAIG|nr:nucleoporin nup43 [Anaeramoeba ignava]